MKCLCILDNNFNFILDLKQDYFLFTDYTDWSTSLEDIIKDPLLNTVKIEISLESQVKELDIYPGRSTIIKYKDLPINNSSTSCGYDGVYTFKVTACNSEQVISRKAVILKSLECAYKELVYKKDWDNALELFKQLELIKANAEICNFDKVKTLYEIASNFIKNLNCNCNDF